MRVVFMGTPQIAAVVLDYLCAQHEVVGVFTRPDAIRGRGKTLMSTPVKELAVSHDIPVVEATSFKDDTVFEQLCAFEPDVICVVAFGVLLPKRVLDLPRYGCLNVHASLLPRWRGAAPIQRAILAGDVETGISIMRMEEGLDTGSYCVNRSLEIGDLTCDELTDELSYLGASGLLVALEHIELGNVLWIDQDESQVTYAHKIEKGELDLSPEESFESALRKVRASDASHTSRCVIGNRSCQIVRARRLNEEELSWFDAVQEGSVVYRAKQLCLVFSDGALCVETVKPDGKKEMTGQSFAAGLQGVKQGTVSWSGCQ